MRITHTAFQISTVERVDRFFGELIGLDPVREYETDAELMKQIFGIEQGFRVRWYEIGSEIVEIFIGAFKDHRIPNSLNHICLSVPDRKGFIQRAMGMRFRVFEKERDNKPNLIFIYDDDGNPYEIVEENPTKD